MNEDLKHYNPKGSIKQQAQVRLLEIMCEVDKICKKHSITYWLDFGTLLGAVRHGGFIPWDDDLDIAVFRKDYARLRKVLMEELPEDYKFQDWKNDKYAFDNYGRVRDLNSKFNYTRFRKQKYQGLFVDIFTVESMPSVKLKKRVDFLYGRVFRQLNNYGTVMYNSALKNNIVSVIAALLYPFVGGFVGLLRLYAKLFPGKKLGLSYSIYFYSERRMDEILPCRPILFEGKEFMAPSQPEACLTRIYGDYMRLPAEKYRIGHGVEIEVNPKKKV